MKKRSGTRTERRGVYSLLLKAAWCAVVAVMLGLLARAEVVEELTHAGGHGECNLFLSFPVQKALYQEDVAWMMDSALARHGEREWRAAVLTNELHGHLGVYATVGVKMGLRAREYFPLPHAAIQVLTFAGSNPPVSCMNDGLQVSTGSTVGHGLITVSDEPLVRPEALFTQNGKTIRLTLKPAYAERICKEVGEAEQRYGHSAAYWQRIRALALQYWLEMDRQEMFVLQEE